MDYICSLRISHPFNCCVSLQSSSSCSNMNAKKTQVMACVPGKIRDSWIEEVYHNSRLGRTLLTDLKPKRLWVHCNIFGERLQASSLQSHLQTQPDVYRSFFVSSDLCDVAPAMFCADIGTATSEYVCPVPGCIGTANTEYSLRRHFVMHHPTHLVRIPKEGTLPLLHWPVCGLQTPVEALSNAGTRAHRSDSMRQQETPSLPSRHGLLCTARNWSKCQCSNI